MTFGFGDIFSMTCPACGATIGDPVRHELFHDALGEIARKVTAPDLSPEEWRAAVKDVLPGAEALVDAHRAVRAEEERAAFEERRAKREEALRAKRKAEGKP